MRTLALLCMVVLSACPERNDCFVSGSGSFGAPPVPLFAVEGERYATTVGQPLAKCGLEPAIVSVRVEILSPDNLPVTAEVEQIPYDPKTGSSAAVVSFVPTQPGSWQIITTFEPGLGRAQSELFVAHAHRDAGRSSVTLPMMAASCEGQPYRTTHGLVLCEVDGVVTTLRATGDAGIGVFTGEQLVVLGNTVWSSKGNTLTHRTDTGTELRVDAEMTLIEHPRTYAGFTNERTAIRGSDRGRFYERIDFIDGGLVQTGLPISVEEDIFMTSDGGLWQAAYNQLCQAGLSIDAGCRTFDTIRVVAFDDDGLWLAGDEFDGPPSHLPSPFLLASRRALASAPGFLVRPKEYPRALVAREQLSYSNIPTIGSLLLRVTKGELRFDWYAEIANEVILGTSGDYVVTARSLSNRVTFIEKEY